LFTFIHSNASLHCFICPAIVIGLHRSNFFSILDSRLTFSVIVLICLALHLIEMDTGPPE
jgi:hypothetical protein